MRPSRRQMQPFTRRWSAGKPSVTALLIALHCAAFSAQCVIELVKADWMLNTGWLMQWIALSGAGIDAGRYWQFVSFPLLHHGPLPFHLLGNMLLLYLAGREVEPIIGTRHFVALYVLGNLIGGVTHWFGMPGSELVGASAGVAALVAAYSTILPELEVTVNLFFVVPLRLRAKYLALAFVAVALLLCATMTAPAIGPVAVLAGSFLGWLYVKQLGFGNPLAIQRYIFNKRQRAARLERMSADQFISAEIDPILDKIARDGMHSLSRAERKILEKGREKIAARTAKK